MTVTDRKHLVNTWIEHQHKTHTQGFIHNETFWTFEKLYDVVLNQPELAWELILQILSIDQSNVVYENLSAGPLEDFLVYHGEQYIEKIENQARLDKNFNELLGGVWRNNISEYIWRRIETVRTNT